VGVYENSPKIFFDESGKPAGIFIDIIENIAKSENWNLEYVKGTWGGGLTRLENNQIDLMPDVAYTSSRDKVFDYHDEPVLSDWFQVYANQGNKINSIVDLDGKHVLVLEHSVQHETFSQLVDDFNLKVTLTTTPDYKTMFKMVQSGKADAAITNRFYGQMHERQYNLKNTAIIFNPTKLFFATDAGKNRTLLNTIDKHLKTMKNNSDSVYYQSLKRWTSEEVEFLIPPWIKITGFIIIAGLFVSIMGSFILKHQVNSRTKELVKINQEMEETVKKRTAQLEEAMERAKAADRLKSAFLATMSHELRTPLNSIIGFTGILLQELAGPLNEEQHKQLSMIKNSSHHLLNLINDVLDISKIEAGQLSLSYSAFDLKDAISNIVATIRPLAENKRLEVKSDISENVGNIVSDQRRVEQILINLLNNAIKFTEEGYVKISCKPDKGEYVLNVEDTGIGISGEDIKGLFQPFHQLDTGLSRKHEGTGLGLSICKKLITMMGGSINITSEISKGSTFTIRIPVKRGEKM